jgi:hypothetical protein
MPARAEYLEPVVLLNRREERIRLREKMQRVDENHLVGVIAKGEQGCSLHASQVQDQTLILSRMPALCMACKMTSSPAMSAVVNTGVEYVSAAFFRSLISCGSGC